MSRQVYRIRLERYHRGGAVTTQLTQAVFTEFAQARVEAARLQRDFDAECAPVTVLIVDRAGLPRWRAGAVEAAEKEADEGERESLAVVVGGRSRFF